MLELPLRKDMKSEERKEVLTEIYQKLINEVGKKTILVCRVI